jgi:uncharacterized protein
MSLLQGPGRGRAIVRFLVAAGWLLVTHYLSNRAAHGFNHGAAFPLIRNLFQIFMLIIGFGYMELSWDRSREPIRAMGLAPRPGGLREFGVGAALGWGMATVVLLVIALVGHFYVQLWTAPRAWAALVLQLLTLAAGALAGEIAFRGYPFQKLVEAFGPFTATILAAILFGALRATVPGSTPTAVWVSAVAAILLSVAYLRTHALWVSWGLHFAWVVSIGVLFGQPLANSRQVSSVIHTSADGPLWLTGGEFGPEGSLISLIVLWVGLYFLVRVTRDLAWKYGQPEIKPAGMPVDLSHPMHPTPPPAAATVAASEPAKAGLVQIAPMNAAGTPARQERAENVISSGLPQDGSGPESESPRQVQDEENY